MVPEVLVERHLLALVPAPPPALPIPCLIDDDPVDPGSQRRLAAEGVDGAEDPEEDFLGEIEGFVVVAQQVEGQLVDHALVLVHELGTGILVANRAALNERSLPAADVGPSDGSKRLHRKTLCHLTTRAQPSWMLLAPSISLEPPGRLKFHRVDPGLGLGTGRVFGQSGAREGQDCHKGRGSGIGDQTGSGGTDSFGISGIWERISLCETPHPRAGDSPGRHDGRLRVCGHEAGAPVSPAGCRRRHRNGAGGRGQGGRDLR